MMNQPLVLFRIRPASTDDELKLATGVSHLTEEDGFVRVRLDMQTGETVVLGKDESHLESIRNSLQRKYAVTAVFGAPQAAYRETIRKAVIEKGTFIRRLDDSRQYGQCIIKVEPLDNSDEFSFSIPGNYRHARHEDLIAIEDGIRKGLQGGVLLGVPVIGLRVSLKEASFGDPDSNAMTLEIAAMMAARSACKKADPTVLEPIVSLVLSVPVRLKEEVLSNLHGRRAVIENIADLESKTEIRGLVPVSEVLGYEASLRLKYGGDVSLALRPAHFAEVPPNILGKLLSPEGPGGEGA